MQNNVPGAVPLFKDAIKQTTAPLRHSPRLAKTEIPEPFKIPREPNLTQIPMANSSIVSSAEVDVITDKVLNEDDHTWTPDKFIENNPGGRAGSSNQILTSNIFVPL